MKGGIMKIVSRKLSFGLAILMALVFSLFAYAEVPDIQEGDWEYTMEMKIEGMPVPMPPVTTKFTQCLTKEDIIPKPVNKDDQCEMIEQKISGNMVAWKMRCKVKDGVTTYSEGEITYSGTSFDGTMKMKVTDEDGQTMNQTVKMTGRRIGDCKK